MNEPGKCDTVVIHAGHWTWCEEDAIKGSTLCLKHEQARQRSREKKQ